MRVIEYNVSFENMISRIPGLFAYLESDEFGNVSLHKATDSLDGCWGKIVENIVLQVDFLLKEEEGETPILNKNEVYSYRTIMSYYYQYLDEIKKNEKYTTNEEGLDSPITQEEYQKLSEDDKKKYKLEKNKFREFVENGIGKIDVDFEGKTEMTPKFLYLSQVKSLYNKLVKMKKLCDWYYDSEDSCNERNEPNEEDKDSNTCCVCERYCQMGGDAFKDYVGSLIQEAEDVASNYYDYALEAEKGNEEKHIEPKPMTLDFDIDLMSTYQDLGIMTPYVPQWMPGRKYYVGDNVEYDGELYVCTAENSGKWDNGYLAVLFDNSKFEKPSNFMKVYDNDGKPQDLTDKIEITGSTDSKLVGLRRFTTYYNNGATERPNDGYDWLFYYRKGNVSNITTINDDLGNIASYSAYQNGEIEAATVDSDEVCSDLMAYGDVITNIEVVDPYLNIVDGVRKTKAKYALISDPQEKLKYVFDPKITFNYVVDARLRATTAGQTADDDGNILYKWKNFMPIDNTGIKYEESYIYEEGSDLDKLVNGELEIEEASPKPTFDDYIIGNFDKHLRSFKFEFITLNGTLNREKTISNQTAHITSILTDLTASRSDFNEFTNASLTREDFYNGITYKPTKDIDVHIERGSTSVFDKHISLGEIKTMEDMTEYKNSSFFKMTES